jgi:Na+/citrate or Na+/malate symporter
MNKIYLSLEKKSNVEKITPIIKPILIIGSFFLILAALLANKGAEIIENNGKTALIIPIKDLDAPRNSEKFEINKLPAI